MNKLLFGAAFCALAATGAAAIPLSSPQPQLVTKATFDVLSEVFTKAGFSVTPMQQDGVQFLAIGIPQAPDLKMAAMPIGCETAAQCDSFGITVTLNPDILTADLKEKASYMIYYARLVTHEGHAYMEGDYLVAGGVTKENMRIDVNVFMTALSKLVDLVKSEGQTVENTGPNPANSKDALAKIQTAFGGAANAPKIFLNDPSLLAAAVREESARTRKP